MLVVFSGFCMFPRVRMQERGLGPKYPTLSVFGIQRPRISASILHKLQKQKTYLSENPMNIP